MKLYVGENIVNKTDHKHWSAFFLLFVCFGSDPCTEDVTYYTNDTMTRLSAPENFILHCRRESFKN